MRVGIAGLAGRMGRMVAEECASCSIVVSGGTIAPGDSLTGSIPIFADIGSLAAVSDVVVDFTHRSCVRTHAAALVGAGTAWVLGTTGLSLEEQDFVEQAASNVAVVQASNFSPGMALVMELARQLGSALPAAEYDAEIIEMHHRQKTDAPSGTALSLGYAVAEGRGLDEASRHFTIDRSDPRATGSIGFAASRGGQIVGRHTLMFAGRDEIISLSHEAVDRRVFAVGAVRAALWTDGQPAGLWGMTDVIGTTSRQ